MNEAEPRPALRAEGAPRADRPVTVAELLLALATYPLEARVSTYENGGGGGAIHVELVEGGKWVEVWTGGWDIHPRPCPSEIVKVVERSHPLDDYAAAKEVLEWLDPAGDLLPHAPAELAQLFARRQAR